MSGAFFVVATPIGNLSDVTLRALETLKMVDAILCEDTRVTKNLLAHYQISKPLIIYHHHSDARKTNEIIKMLEHGQNLALVTDAGTPGISDPGNELVKDLRLKIEDLKIIPIPGVSAVATALSIAGFKTDKFLFLGFPPHKTKRAKFFKEVSASEHTAVFYESSHRIVKCIAELAEVLDPKREVVICRELTKMFETIYRGTIQEISKMKMDERGEFVVIISNA